MPHLLPHMEARSKIKNIVINTAFPGENTNSNPEQMANKDTKFKARYRAEYLLQLNIGHKICKNQKGAYISIKTIQ